MANKIKKIKINNNTYELDVDGYLPLSGGTLTGKLNVGSDAATMTSGLLYVNSVKPSAGQAMHAGNAIIFGSSGSQNDQAWIRTTGTSESDMKLEIGTGDDGSTDFNIHFTSYNTSSAVVNDIVMPKDSGTVALTKNIPSTLKNPYSISFTDTSGVAQSYDGSAALDLSSGIYYAATANQATYANNFGNSSSYWACDLATENTSDTWVPVINSGKLQHRVIPTIYNSSPESWLGSKISSMTITGSTLDLHPESSLVLLPYITNDLAFNCIKGYSAVITNTTTGTTIGSGTSLNNIFDASPNYYSFSVSATSDVVTIVIKHQGFYWGQQNYIGFGNSGWGAKSVKWESGFSPTGTGTASSPDSDITWSTVGSTTSAGQIYRCSGGATVSGRTDNPCNYTRITLTNFRNTSPRIAQIGKLSYSSELLRSIYLSRDGGTLYGNIKAPAFQSSNSSKDYIDFISGTGVNFGVKGTSGVVYDLSKCLTDVTVVNSKPTLSWGTTSTVGTVKGTALQVTMPSNPNTNYTYAFNIQGNGTTATSFTQNSAKTLNIVGSGGTSVSASTDKITISTDLSSYAKSASIGNGTLTIQKNGTSVGTFTANQSSNSTVNLTVPTKLSELTNDIVNNGTLTIQANGTSKGTFTANQSGNSTINITASDLGLSTAMKFGGVASQSLSENGTQNAGATSGNYTSSTQPSNGTVYLDSGKHLEYVWVEGTSSAVGRWELLGQDGSYALSSVTVTGSGALGGGGNLTANRTITHNAGSAASKSTGLYKFSTDAYSHVSSITTVTKSDITALGIPASDTNTTYSLTQDSSDGHKITFAGSDGSSKTITIPDNNTTYSAGTNISISGNAISCTYSYSLPTASSSSLGGIKTGFTTNATNRNYKVQVDSSGNAYVNVPWTDNDHNDNTTYSINTGTSNKITLTPSSGTAQTLTIDGVSNASYATTAGSATKATTADSATTAGSATKATQDGNGNVITSTYIPKEATLDDGIDLNTVTTSGFYRLNATTTNGPGGTSNTGLVAHGQLLVVHGGADTISQFVMPYASSMVYIRNGNAVNNSSGTWKAWTTLANTDQVSAKADKATTLAGYGITDAKIENGKITLGSNSITPLTSHLTVDSALSSTSTNPVQNKVINSALAGKASSSHTHSTSIAASTDTSSITLAHGAKYKLTAGGTSYVFTMPTDNNTVYTHPTGSGASKTFGLYKFSTDSTSHISDVTAVTKADITGLGIPSSDTNTHLIIKSLNGSTITSINNDSASDVTFVAGTNVTLSPDATNRKITIAAKDTTYSFSASNPTLSWGATSTIGTVGGTTLKVTMPSNPNINTTYTLTQDSSDGHKLTFTGTDGTSKSITIPDNDTVYTHPTVTANPASAVKVGNDALGHVVIGGALTASDIGAAASSHTHSNYVDKSGDEMSGELILPTLSYSNNSKTVVTVQYDADTESLTTYFA